MSDKAKASLNALKTGAYSRAALLPWESAQEFEKLKTAIFEDYRPKGAMEESTVLSIVENRWARERQRQTTAIANQRHEFGRALENSGARSWAEVLEMVRRRAKQIFAKLDDIETSIGRTAASAQHLEESSEIEELEKLARRIAETCDKELEVLAGLKIALDEQEEFFRVYSPKHLERRVKLEKSLDAQLMKLHADFQIVHESRILREKEPGWKLPVEHDNVGDAGVPKASVGGQSNDAGQCDLAELERDDDEDVAEENQNDVFADDSGRKKRRMFDDDDALRHIIDDEEGDEKGETDDDDLDDWGMPKN